MSEPPNRPGGQGNRTTGKHHDRSASPGSHHGETARRHPLGDGIAVFGLVLRAEGKAAKTTRTYTDAASWLGASAAAVGLTSSDR